MKTDERLVRLEASYRNLDRVNGWIANAETKAGALLAASGVLLGIISFRTSGEIKTIVSGGSALQVATSAIFVPYVLFFLASLVHSALVFLPRIQPPQPSVFFFGAISKMSPSEFGIAIKGLDLTQIEEELIQQTHTNSVIASKKFEHVIVAFKYFVVALVLGVILSVIKSLGS